MKALVFDYKVSRLAISRIFGSFFLKGYLTKLGFLHLKEIACPNIKNDKWVIVKTKFCGICGSDHKQVFLDGNRDNPMTAVISWPQILGHEAVGIITKGETSKGLHIGDRVVLNPWLGCVPRGIDPPCIACQAGNNTLCRNFTNGNLTRGIHTGNSSDATGGFAEFFPAHNSMAFKIPDDISWDQATLSDPFSVAFHSILKVSPKPGSICAVYGCGNLGLLTIHILKSVFKEVQVIAIAKFEHQAKMAENFGADKIIRSDYTYKIIEKIADFVQCDILYLKKKKPWLIEGVDFLFDTVASPETLETGIRIVKSRSTPNDSKSRGSGTIVVTGVSSPKRFEWTPWYFKEIRIVGSNAFSVEEYEGYKEHSYEHYFRFLRDGRVNPSEMITHKFPLSLYKKAFLTAHNQEKYKSIKVGFSY